MYNLHLYYSHNIKNDTIIYNHVLKCEIVCVKLCILRENKDKNNRMIIIVLTKYLFLAVFVSCDQKPHYIGVIMIMDN